MIVLSVLPIVRATSWVESEPTRTELDCTCRGLNTILDGTSFVSRSGFNVSLLTNSKKKKAHSTRADWINLNFSSPGDLIIKKKNKSYIKKTVQIII